MGIHSNEAQTMKPPVKKFDRANPCTKVELWNAFRGRRTFRKSVQVAVAHSIIGVNAPRNMLAKGYVEVVESRGVESYALTEDGAAWLTKGLQNFLKRHPERVEDARNVPARMLAEVSK